MSRILSSREVWGVPAVLGVLSLVGLVAALVADGLGDVLSWVTLAVPVAASVWGFKRRPTHEAKPSSVAPRRAVRVRPPPGL